MTLLTRGYKREERRGGEGGEEKEHTDKDERRTGTPGTTQ